MPQRSLPTLGAVVLLALGCLGGAARAQQGTASLAGEKGNAPTLIDLATLSR